MKENLRDSPGVASARLSKAENALFFLGLAALLTLQCILFRNSGALWRDEIHSVVLARMPHWTTMFASLYVDSFPALWVTLLRLWIVVSSSEEWLRAIGPLMYVAALTALWVGARWSGARVPILALAFVGFNPAIFYYGSSLRAYGLALGLILLLFGAVWRMTESPRWQTTFGAGALAILSANANYQNSYLIFAICGAGASLCFARGLWRRGLSVLGCGVVAAISLTPYLNTIRRFTAGGVIRQKVITPGSLLMEFCEVFDSARWIILPAILLLFVLLACAFARGWIVRKGAWLDERGGRASFYGLLVILLAVATLYRFMLAAGFPTFPWHYIPFLGLVMLALDTGLDGILGAAPPARVARLAIALGIMVASACPWGRLGPVWTAARVRRTNMDLIAKDIAGVASRNDLVLVSPFWYSYSFKYYYKGGASWSTLPMVPPEQIDLEYDSMKPLMAEREPLAPTLSRIRDTLRGGGRVWVAGRLAVGEAGSTPPTISPAPDPVYGWDNVQYMTVWSLQTSSYLSRHVTRLITGVEEGDRNPVNALEHGCISMAEGWRD